MKIAIPSTEYVESGGYTVRSHHRSNQAVSVRSAAQP